MSVLNATTCQPLTSHRKTMLRTLAALLFAVALATAASAQNTVTFYDGSFAPGWVGSVAGVTGTVNYTFVPVAAGGYPGAFEKESHNLTAIGGQAFMYLANFNPVNTYTGAFKSLSYSYSLTNPGIHDVLYAIAVQQTVAGVPTVYIPDTSRFFDAVLLGDTFATAPNPYFVTGLTGSDFCRIPPNISASNPLDCSSNPDFISSTAQTLFGYVVANSFSGTGTGHYVTGLDNWCVVLDGASNPGGVGRGCRGVN